MYQIEKISQTYSQAPWRKQLQIIGLFLLGLVFMALVAGIYLDVSARASAVGREIQAMQKEIETLDRNIEDLQSQLAFILSAGEMDKRVNDLGFKPIEADQIVYLSVPGYSGRSATALAPYSKQPIRSAYYLPPEFTESLFAWLERQVVQLSWLTEVHP
jgi:cell division protein FtsL